MPYVAVIGPGEANPGERQIAEDVGQALGQAGATIVCGGLGGVMAAASKGATQAGGTTVGILPGTSRADGNEWLTIALPTGMGELRNGLVVRAADAVIAIGGAYGTLSEVALALAAAVPVLGLGTWEIDGVQTVSTPDQAVSQALALAARSAG